MKKVKNHNYHMYRKILSKDNPSFSSILAGNSKGELWVNSVQNPTVALVYSHPVGGFSIMGMPEDYKCFLKFLKENLFVELKEKGFNYFEFSVEEGSLEKQLLETFSEKRINQEDEFYFRKYNKSEINSLNNYKIIPVDLEMINQLNSEGYKNPGFVTTRILESWESYDQFLNNSLAFIAVKEKMIAGVIVGTAIYEKVLAIDIETHQDHRKKGVAKTLTQHFVNACIQKERIPQWNCVDSNIASRNTAESLGFQLIKKKPFYWFKI